MSDLWINFNAPLSLLAHREARSTNCTRREICSRGIYLILIPIGVALRSLHVAQGALASVGMFLTGGCVPSINKYAVQHLSLSRFILPMVLYNLLRTINLKSTITGIRKADPSSNVSKSIPHPRNGILTEILINESGTEFLTLTKSPYRAVRNVVSRLSFVVLAVAFTITRVVDGVIGIIATPLSLLCLGKSDRLNSTAFLGLTFTNLPLSLIYFAIRTINPQAQFT